jgi:hypothetical protein
MNWGREDRSYYLRPYLESLATYEAFNLVSISFIVPKNPIISNRLIFVTHRFLMAYSHL